MIDVVLAGVLSLLVVGQVQAQQPAGQLPGTQNPQSGSSNLFRQNSSSVQEPVDSSELGTSRSIRLPNGPPAAPISEEDSQSASRWLWAFLPIAAAGAVGSYAWRKRNRIAHSGPVEQAYSEPEPESKEVKKIAAAKSQPSSKKKKRRNQTKKKR